MSTDTAYASGTWNVRAGSEDEFTKRWEEFLTWTRDNVEGLEQARLLRETSDPRHFVSLSRWSSADARDHWKSLPGFMERFAACRELCDEFAGSDYTLELTI